MTLVRYRHGCHWKSGDKFSQAFVYAWTAHWMRWLGILKWSDTVIR